ncbi:flagellar biosynthesis protein FlhB [Desulfatibacillum aliphaticivorans]|uniref:Flagellar biosynthetic protein FlhB n=1 Tax=Desulfatibacillum aliphaticivorans TaxID=218208 RepID=B8FK32_DESAL|nr:flagellar biosynthesis protein FlhB [Desulfatibacillum aliphaticivorans]ACL02707.1 Flagellar biosynthetic protein FlhB [Desulfatibacillum aliphaticivorans]
MADSPNEDKTEQPTPKKRDDARKKGQVAKSRDLSSVVVLMAGLGIMYMFGPYMHYHITSLMENIFTTDVSAWGVEEINTLGREMVREFLFILAPILAGVFVVGFASAAVQVGFYFSWEAAAPKFSKINPISGFGRMFSKQALVELAKSLAKLFIVGFISYLTIEAEMDNLILLGQVDAANTLAYVLKIILKLFIRVGIIMVFVAVLDFAFQKWHHEQQLKMTKQEVKDEYKQTDGDPMVKARIRRIQMEAARRRMMEEVPKADVVVTNPTHLALAIKYNALTMGAPLIVAKGAGPIAQKIKEVARENDVPIVENKELARALYKVVDIGDEVPVALYEAVAEVLAYVYGLKQNRARSFS